MQISTRQINILTFFPLDLIKLNFFSWLKVTETRQSKQCHFCNLLDKSLISQGYQSGLIGQIGTAGPGGQGGQGGQP